MPGLQDTIAALMRHRKRPLPAQRRAVSRMQETTNFGANPGALRMLVYRPDFLPPGAPLVVVLHGCTQSAEAYAHGAGWLDLADRHGFIVVAPEQTQANNPSLCFNWFNPGDVRRDEGEAASIRAMVDVAVRAFGADPTRIFVTGLSAGGAMTSALLAAYPEVFAAGAVVAGLPHGAAASVQEAFAAMAAAQPREQQHWGDKVRAASAHAGPWPRIAIWHGDADATVRPGNRDAIIAQWRDVHDLNLTPTRTDNLAGHRREVWANAAGDPTIECVTIGGMGHGAAVGAAGPDGCGEAGPYLIETGLSSAQEIARFFGIAKPGVARAAPRLKDPPPAHHGFDPGAVITRALRAAGLMK